MASFYVEHYDPRAHVFQNFHDYVIKSECESSMKLFISRHFFVTLLYSLTSFPNGYPFSFVY